MRLSRDDRRIAFEIELLPGNARHASTSMNARTHECRPNGFFSALLAWILGLGTPSSRDRSRRVDICRRAQRVLQLEVFE